ncbi:MAG: M23 family metallopeptidase [Hyphomicrobiales bacterium]|nr:MAG: M23 family metallopeptidase [Hyphomicrobiales bacterium]
MRALLTAIVIFFTAPALAAAATLDEGRATAAAFLGGNHAALWDDLSPELQGLIGSSDGFGAFRASLTDSFGEETEILDETVTPGEGYEIYTRISRWTRSDTPILMQLGLTAGGTIVSFLVQPQPALADSRFLDYATKTPLQLPFAGEWFVVWGGRTIETNYHAADRAQRFATDLLIYRDGLTHRGEPQKLESYYCWDEPILAPAAGTIASVVADLPDNPIGSTDTQNPAGNHVVLDFGNGELAFLAHMRQGSISLRPGDTVTAGQQLGRCGNSGNTSEPHLHIHLQTTADLRDGEGLPAFFNAYVADGQPVARGEPQAGQQIRQVQ